MSVYLLIYTPVFINLTKIYNFVASHVLVENYSLPNCIIFFLPYFPLLDYFVIWSLPNIFPFFSEFSPLLLIRTVTATNQPPPPFHHTTPIPTFVRLCPPISNIAILYCAIFFLVCIDLETML